MAKLTFEEACELTGKNPQVLPGVEGLTEAAGNRIIAGYKLDVLNEAFKKQDNFTPDFADDDQAKYTAWMEWSASAGGFVFLCTYCTYALTYLGARFWFVSRNRAQQFCEENIDLINDLHRAG